MMQLEEAQLAGGWRATSAKANSDRRRQLFGAGRPA
jgi:hypothetical protein